MAIRRSKKLEVNKVGVEERKQSQASPTCMPLLVNIPIRHSIQVPSIEAPYIDIVKFG